MTHRKFSPDVTGGNANAYQDADQYLGSRDSRKLENHTYLKRRFISGNSIAVMLWNTDVVTYNQDGSIILDSGRYHTVTTKDRMNSYNPLGSVWTEKGDWWYRSSYLGAGDDFGHYEYIDGMVIQPNGAPSTPRREITLMERKFDRSFADIKEAGDFILGLELVQVKQLTRNRHLKQFALEHCKREFVPAFIGREEFASIIERRMKDEQISQ